MSKIGSSSLPVVRCDGCGVCCFHMGYPAYVRPAQPMSAQEIAEFEGTLDTPLTPKRRQELAAGHPGEVHWHRLPTELKQELLEYMDGYQLPNYGQTLDTFDGPCIWLDLETRRCKHHEYRPNVCRDFETGNPECLQWRRTYADRILNTDIDLVAQAAKTVDALGTSPNEFQLVPDHAGSGQQIFLSDQWVIASSVPGAGFLPATGCFLLSRDLYDSGRLDRRAHFVASSRLPKKLDDHGDWFAALRTVGRNLTHDRWQKTSASPEVSHELLITAATTAAHPYVVRLAELMEIDCVHFDQRTVTSLTAADLQNANRDAVVFSLSLDTPPAIDQLLCSIAHTVFAVSVRGGGNVLDAMKDRTASIAQESAQNFDQTQEANENPGPARTFLLNNNRLVSKKIRQQFQSAATIDWILLAPELPEPTVQPASQVPSVISINDINQSEYLIHWTRRPAGPWPNQSPASLVDDLLFQTHSGDRSERTALCRILANRRLIASNRLLRGSTPVVCFSEVLLSEIRQRTVFRKHLQRWDFVPFGIAIKKDKIADLGGKPVIYGDDDDFARLADGDRPWFQKNQSSDGKIDWSQEKEWRIVGDVNLARLNPSDAVVFADDADDVKLLTQFGPFDVVVLPPSDSIRC